MRVRGGRHRRRRHRRWTFIASQPRSRQYYLPPREGDNLIDARATLGLVAGIAPSSRETRSSRRVIMHVGCNSSTDPRGIARLQKQRPGARVCRDGSKRWQRTSSPLTIDGRLDLKKLVSMNYQTFFDSLFSFWKISILVSEGIKGSNDSLTSMANIYLV